MSVPAAGDPIPASTKAALFCEALPFIQRYRGATSVVKYGGIAIGHESEALASFAQDVALLRALGMVPIVVHGGGPQIGAMMARLGKVPEFKEGLRVTDAETLDIARMVLVGKVNRDIVGAINLQGQLAVGLSGEDGGLIVASQRDPALGFVGDVASVDASMLKRLVADGVVPVVATIGSDLAGQAYNINADTVAGAIAESLGAEKLVFLTDVDGVRREPDSAASLISRLSPDDLDSLISSGVVAGGMIPKARACAAAVRSGVGSAHVLDGRVEHALVLELLTAEGVGTMVVPR